MIFPRLERYADGRLAFEDLAPAFLMLLMEVPDLLKTDEQPDEARRRLFPEPGDDARMQEDWRRLVHPELFALLASAREVVLRDLGGIRPSNPEIGMGTWRMEIPPEHVHAWISALNAARLTLGAIHGIESEEDLHTFDDEPSEPGDEVGADDAEPGFDFSERRFAITKIHLLGELQAMLIMDQCPPPPGFFPSMREPGDEDEDEEEGEEEGDRGQDGQGG